MTTTDTVRFGSDINAYLYYNRKNFVIYIDRKEAGSPSLSSPPLITSPTHPNTHTHSYSMVMVLA